MKKERLFYLDFIRAFATFVIVLTHFNALFLYNVYRPEISVITTFVGNIYIGSLGVSLFLIISGSAMMYVYGDPDRQINWGTFYKKRVITLFPTFYVCYAVCFALDFIRYPAAILYNAPVWHFVFSLLGIDGYLLNFGVPVFYVVGEWFLGFILLVYLILPLLILAMRKHPIIPAAVVLPIYILSLIFCKNLSYHNILPTERLMEVVIGMYLVRYVKKVHWYTALISLAVIVLNHIFKPTWNGSLQMTYIGVAAFLILVFLAGFAQKSVAIQRICKSVCKYSYDCFIVHHWLTYRIASHFDLASISLKQTYFLFAVTLLAVIAASIALHWLTSKIVSAVSSVFSKEPAPSV